MLKFMYKHQLKPSCFFPQFGIFVSSLKMSNELRENAKKIFGAKKTEDRERKGVNFINILRAHFSYKILVPKLQSCVLGLKLEKSCKKTTFVRKTRAQNNDEIDRRCIQTWGAISYPKFKSSIITLNT